LSLLRASTWLLLRSIELPEENLGLETGFGQYPLAINLVRLVFDFRARAIRSNIAKLPELLGKG
jgi:hypothetical protein